MRVRKVDSFEAEKIAEIYNFYVLNTHSSFEIEAVTSEEMSRRISEISDNYPFLVCEETGEILGYAYAARYKTRAAYLHSVEISVYVKNDVHRRGIGSQLYEKLFESLSETDACAVIAGIALPNEASVKLHEKFGMRKVAHFHKVGFKFGRWIDVGYWQTFNKTESGALKSSKL